MSMIYPKREQKKWAMLVNNGMEELVEGELKALLQSFPPQELKTPTFIANELITNRKRLLTCTQYLVQIVDLSSIC